jgi:two-component system nitrogen regulation response regulator GlnG
MPSLLVIDDEPGVLYSFGRVFEDSGIKVLTAATAAEGLASLRENNPDVVVLDLQLPDRPGLEVFQEIRELDLKQPVIFITAHGTAETAIEAMKHGAFDYLVKPVSLERLGSIIERAIEASRLMRVPAVLPADDQEDRIIGRSPVMQEMSKAIGRIATQDVNVLILGESGTGKELVARAIYHHSRRCHRPFMAINCAAIPETLLESELFGHEAGAFTGATRRRIGKFEQCDGGTLLLDEIGDMLPGLQAKMLRILQDQQFERVGANDTITTRVRILAATNQNLEKLVNEGRFRKDLYYRLKVITIHVPPLRDRVEDVAELASHFLFGFDRELGADIRIFAPEAMDLLQAYDWPGNVRELQSTVKAAMLNASGHVILPEFLPDSVRGLQAAGPTAEPPGTLKDVGKMADALLRSGERDLYRTVIGRAERELLERVMRWSKNNQRQASELLGLDRKTLRTKLRHFDTTGATTSSDAVDDEQPAD